MNSMNGCRGNMGCRGNRNCRAVPESCDCMPDNVPSCNMTPQDAACRTAEGQCRNDSAGDSCTDPLYGRPLAIGYVPWQQWRKIYDPADGLANGTIFPELNLQFYGCIPQGCAKGGRL